MDYEGVPAVLYGLAEKESEKGNFLLSSAVFRKLRSLPLDPRNPMADCAMRSTQDMYSYGMQLRDAGDWETAAAIFDQLKGIGEANEHSNESYYAIAAALEENEKFSQAAVAFDALGNYSDAAERAKKNRYSAAAKLLESGAYDAADAAFTALGDYPGAADMVKECRYRKAGGLFDAGLYEAAKDAYGKLGSYKNSDGFRKGCIYRIAEQHLEKKRYQEAIEAYNQIRGYSDTGAKITACRLAIGDGHVQKAEDLLRKGDTNGAATAYQAAMAEYEKAGDTGKAETAALRTAECYQSVNDLNTALQWYRKAGDAGKARIVGIAEYAFRTEQFGAAEKLAVEVGSEDAKSILYRLAEKKLAEGDTEAAVRLFEEAGDYKDAPQRREETLLPLTEKLITAEKYTEAEEIANQLGGQSGQQLIYSIADALLKNNGDEDEALRLFGVAGDYSDAKDRHDEILYQRALRLTESGEYIKAVEILDLIPDYKDADMEIKKNTIYALALNGEGSSDEDKTKVAEARQVYVDDMLAAKNYDAAIAMLEKMDRDATTVEKLNDTRYKRAVKLETENKLEEALVAFEALGSYSHAKEYAVHVRCRLAKELVVKGDYDAAATMIFPIRENEEVDPLLAENPELAAAVARNAKYSVGNYVTFGHYPQTSGGYDRTPIEWQVLARDGNKALLISRYGLDAQPYNKEYISITWEKCTLRTWLNDTFMSKAFTTQEQTGILLTSVDNSSGQGYSEWSTNGGNNTKDKIFLLSYAEANKYFDVMFGNNNMKSKVAPTAYAIKQGAYTSSSNKTADGTFVGWWWLRSPGYGQYYAAHVDSVGSLNSYFVNYDIGCVRPALWINLESDIF